MSLGVVLYAVGNLFSPFDIDWYLHRYMPRIAPTCFRWLLIVWFEIYCAIWTFLLVLLFFFFFFCFILFSYREEAITTPMSMWLLSCVALSSHLRRKRNVAERAKNLSQIIFMILSIRWSCSFLAFTSQSEWTRRKRKYMSVLGIGTLIELKRIWNEQSILHIGVELRIDAVGIMKTRWSP